MITYNCPHCREVLRVDDCRAGQAYVCSLCGQSSLAPGHPPAAPLTDEQRYRRGVATRVGYVILAIWALAIVLGAVVAYGPMVAVVGALSAYLLITNPDVAIVLAAVAASSLLAAGIVVWATWSYIVGKRR